MMLKKWMPNIVTILFSALLVVTQQVWAGPLASHSVAPAVASSRTTIAYQGLLTDTSGVPVNASLEMVFRLYASESGGSPVWSEAQNAVPVADGSFSVLLGRVTAIPPEILANNQDLWLGITVGSDSEMTPREKLASAPYAMIANVPNSSITTAKLADKAVTAAKLDSTSWTDLPLTAGFFSPPNNDWQRAQYRRISDIVYLRGTITKNALSNIVDADVVAFLPAGLRPAKNLAFTAEPHTWLETKHRLDIWPDGTVMVADTAGATPHVSLDGILFSIGQ